MARRPIVGRHLKTTVATCLVVDEQNHTETIDYRVPRTYKDDVHLLKAVQKAYQEPHKRIVHIMRYKVIRGYYTMPEEKFAELADFQGEE